MRLPARLFLVCCTNAILIASASGAVFVTTSPRLPSAINNVATATLLQNGKVLVAGGYSGSTPISGTLIIDPAAGTAVGGPPMSVARGYHTATLLQNGKVLLAGGATNGGASSAIADLYDPTTNTIAPTGGLTVPRYGHTATLLNDGRVLVTGGVSTSAIVSSGEIYNPATGQFSAAANAMGSAREVHAAALLANGKVFITGGVSGAGTVNTTDLFDPATNSFSPGPTLSTGRYYQSMTVLDNGIVLVAGGYTGSAVTGSTELYDPSLNSFSAGAALQYPRFQHTATLLPNGDVLLTGGGASLSTARAETEVFHPNATTGTTTAHASLNSLRQGHTATLLPGDRILIVGGYGGADTELYEPQSETFTAATNLAHKRYFPTATLLPNGKVLVAGGVDNSITLNTAELIDTTTTPTTVSAAGNFNTARRGNTATLLQNGKVLFAGGYDASSNVVASAELYDPVTNTFSFTGSMNTPRALHTATLLKNGKVLLVGGGNSITGTLASAELYDPITGMFTNTDSLSNARYSHAAALLQDGTVFISGGLVNGSANHSVEIYDPVAGTFSTGIVPGMLYARYGHTSTTLQNGDVLLAGGGNNVSIATEIFHPGAGYVIADPTTRDDHFAILLPDNTVILASGLGEQGFNIYNPTTITMGTTSTPGNWWALSAASSARDGKLLVAGGVDQSVPCCPSPGRDATALYDPHPVSSASRVPAVSTVNTICEPASLALTGTGFASAEGSSGSFDSSAANAPMLRLQSVHDDDLQLLQPTSWSPTGFNAQVSNVTYGFYRLSIVSNGIPSHEQFVEIAPAAAPTLGTYANTSVVNAQNTTVTPDAAPNLQGTTGVALTASASAGFLGTLAFNGITGNLTITDPHPVGSYTITITATTGCANASRNFTLTVKQIQKPVIDASAPSSAKVTVSWPAVDGAGSYDIFRSTNVGPTGNGGFTKINTIPASSTPSFDDLNVNPDTTYVYRVAANDADGNGSPLSKSDLATTKIFSDDPLSVNTPILFAHFDDLRTAVNAVRAAAGEAPIVFTDPLVAGAVAHASHMQDLRSGLNDALNIILGSTLTFTYPATSNTPIRATDVTEIRNGVK